LVPEACRNSAAIAGNTSGTVGLQPLNEKILLFPSTRIYSLSESEDKLGFGFRGFQCMGYDFLILLHGENFSQIHKYVNANGEVVATVTFNIYRPYRKPISRDKLAALPVTEFGNTPKNDESLVKYHDGGQK
jgi:hypothetical protein